MSDQKSFVMCMKVGETGMSVAAHRAMIPGVKQGKCANCDADLMLSPSSQALVAGGTVPLCQPCMEAEMETPGRVTEVIMTPAARQEVDRAMERVRDG